MRLYSPEVISTIGLVLDVIGVILIWKFSLGQGMEVKSEDGRAHRIRMGNSKRVLRNTILDWLGVILLVVGFALQICANWIPEEPLRAGFF